VSRTCSPTCQLVRILPETKKTHVLHHANGLFRLGNKLILSLLYLLLRLRAQLVIVMGVSARRGAELPSGSLDASSNSIKRQTGLLDTLASARGKVDIGVEGRIPPSQETALDLCILGQTGLADALHSERILLKRRGQRILAGTGMLLMQRLAAGKTGPGDRMGKRLRLGLGRRWCRESGLCLGWGGGGREEVDLLTDGAPEVLECLLNIRRVIVRLVRVLGTVELAASARAILKLAHEKGQEQNLRDSQHLLVNCLQGINPLLQVNVVGRKLGLSSFSPVSDSQFEVWLSRRSKPCPRPAPIAPWYIEKCARQKV